MSKLIKFIGLDEKPFYLARDKIQVVYTDYHAPISTGITMAGDAPGLHWWTLEPIEEVVARIEED
jgi:hypothetical protein